MTVSSTTNRKEYAGNDVTTSFSTSPVVFFASEDLTVYIVSSTGAVTTLTENTHYTVSGGGTPPATGSVSLAGGSSPYGAPATGATLVIVRDLDIVQETDFVQNDGSDADVAEAALDRLTIIAQQANARIDRTLRLPDSDATGLDLALPAATAVERAGTILGFDGAGTLLELYDPSSAVTAASNVTFTPAGTGAVATTDQAKLRERVSVFDFLTAAQIADVQAGTALVDLATPLAAFATYIAANATRVRGVFPSGRYKASAFPNFAVSNSQLVAEGEVRLRYSGTADGVSIDGGAAGGGVYNFSMLGRFIIEVPTTAQNGVYVRSVHHSDLSLKVLGAGATYAGIRVEWCVCTNFHQPVVSVNEEGWYAAAKPQYGMIFTRRGAGSDYSAYCKVNVPAMEGVDTGIWCDYATGITVNGGTLEGCTSMGFNASSHSQDCKVEDVDFESNTTRDIYDQGTANSFINCDTMKLITVDATALLGRVVGGRHSQISIVAGAVNYRIADVGYNRLNDGSTISDSGTTTRLTNNINVGTAAFDDIPTRVLKKSAVAVSCPADATEDVLATITVPARALGANGRLRITALFSHTNSVNNKTLNIRYSGNAGTQFCTVVASAWVSSEAVVEIANRNATNSQVASARGVFSNGTALSTQRQTSAVDTTAATTVVITGQKATAGETLTLESYCVEIMPS